MPSNGAGRKLRSSCGSRAPFEGWHNGAMVGANGAQDRILQKPQDKGDRNSFICAKPYIRPPARPLQPGSPAGCLCLQANTPDISSDASVFQANGLSHNSPGQSESASAALGSRLRVPCRLKACFIGGWLGCFGLSSLPALLNLAWSASQRAKLLPLSRKEFRPAPSANLSMLFA